MTTTERVPELAPHDLGGGAVASVPEGGADDRPGGDVSRFDEWSDPTLVLAAAGVLALVALVPHPARSLVTLPLALVLPGHALLAALDRPDRRLPGGGRLALRAVLSLAALSLVTLAVGWLVGVGKLAVVTGSWAFASACAIAAWRHPPPARRARHRSPFTQSGVLIGLASLGIVAVVAAAVLLLPEPRQEPFNRLALTGGARDLGNPVATTTAATAPDIEVEVENGTGSTASYRVVPAIDAGHAWEAPEASLEPGETHTFTVSGPLPRGACVSRLTITLSVDGEDSGVAPLVLYLRDEAGTACR